MTDTLDSTGTTTSQRPQSVLFVCLGNICRSPAAEGVMQHLVDQLNLRHLIRVDSAGTAGYHVGKPADSRMLAAAAQRGLELTSRSRLAVPADLKQFDLIVAMDHSNYRDLMSLARDTPPSNVKLLSDYLPAPWPRDVPDPYLGDQQGFEFVLDMLQAACPQILQELLLRAKNTSSA